MRKALFPGADLATLEDVEHLHADQRCACSCGKDGAAPVAEGDGFEVHKTFGTGPVKRSSAFNSEANRIVPPRWQ